MRAPYDTTILASGIVARADPLARVLDAVISGQVEFVTSEYVLEELRRTLDTKPYFLERVSPPECETYLAPQAGCHHRDSSRPRLGSGRRSGR